MAIDLVTVLSDLAGRRPVFHSEKDLQHELAWQIRIKHPESEIRLEPRPHRGIHLDLLVRKAGHRIAVEIKYLAALFRGTVGGESFDIPCQAAQDISRHDVIKDVTRVESLLADGYADQGYVLVLSNDRGYWRPGRTATTIDKAFRLHDDRILEGTLAWGPGAGTGTTARRNVPLSLASRYVCRWRPYSTATTEDGRHSEFRYLLLPITMQANPSTADPPVRPRSSVSATQGRPAGASATAREDILAVARALAVRSGDKTFTLTQILTEMRRAGTRYAESTIRTHVTSRMCADSPDHHATTFDDFERVGPGVYRLKGPPARRPPARYSDR